MLEEKPRKRKKGDFPDPKLLEKLFGGAEGDAKKLTQMSFYLDRDLHAAFSKKLQERGHTASFAFRQMVHLYTHDQLPPLPKLNMNDTDVLAVRFFLDALDKDSKNVREAMVTLVRKTQGLPSISEAKYAARKAVQEKKAAAFLEKHPELKKEKIKRPEEES